MGYGARDRGYDDRGPRGGWRDPDVLGGGGDLVRVLLLSIPLYQSESDCSAREYVVFVKSVVMNVFCEGPSFENLVLRNASSWPMP
jgi:hypothetical protein